MKKIKLFYEQHILPIVYDYSMSLSECVGKLVKVVNGLIEDIQVIDHKTDVAEQNIDVLQERVNTNNTLINNLRSEVEDLEDTVESLPTQDNIDQMNSAITQNSSDIADLDTRVTVLEGMNVYDRLDQAEQNIIDLQGDVSDIEDDIENLNTDISTINTSISGIRNDITSINGSIGTILSDISLINDDISDVKSDITDIEGDIASINTNITSINADITNINSSISSITGDISDINDDISDINSDISSLMQDVSDINGDISNITSDIIGLRSDINNKSTVSYSQIITSGTKIGEITIDGNTIDIYTPDPAISLDDIPYVRYTSGSYTGYPWGGHSDSNELVAQMCQLIDQNSSYIEWLKSDLYLDHGLSSGEYVEYSINQQPLSGQLTGSGKDVYIFIPFNKQLEFEHIESFSISGNVSIRSVNGYLRDSGNTYNFNAIDIAPYNPRVYKTELGFRVLFTLPTAASATNNTPITAYFSGNGKIRITVL